MPRDPRLAPDGTQEIVVVDAARVGNPEIKSFCTACFSGNYPTNDITPEMFTEIERERLGIN